MLIKKVFHIEWLISNMFQTVLKFTILEHWCIYLCNMLTKLILSQFYLPKYLRLHFKDMNWICQPHQNMSLSNRYAIN